MVKETALYDELGISPDATVPQIKAAYRSKALQYHPDKNNGDPAAAEKFKKVAEAYEVLRDTEKRQQYDLFGRSGPAGGGGGGAFPGGAAGFAPGMDPMDLFASFFGFGANMRGGEAYGQQQRQAKPPFLLFEIQCSLEELYCGTEKLVRVRRQRRCPSCHGHGTANGRPAPVCSACMGQKKVRRAVKFHGMLAFQELPCSDCRGEGKRPIASPCARCGPAFEKSQRARLSGEANANATAIISCRGVVQEETFITVRIAPGTEDSDAITFPGEGDELPGCDAAGDILVVIEQLPHPCYRRINKADLFLSNCRVPLWYLLRDPLRLPIELLDGRVVQLAPPLREGGVPRFLFDAQHVFVVENEGMPVKQAAHEKGTCPAASSGKDNGATSKGVAHLKKGRLYVCVEVVFPSALEAKQLNAIAKVLNHNDITEDETRTGARGNFSSAQLVSLRPHDGPAPSWFTVDAHGNATYRPQQLSAGTKKRKATAAR